MPYRQGSCSAFRSMTTRSCATSVTSETCALVSTSFLHHPKQPFNWQGHSGGQSSLLRPCLALLPLSLELKGLRLRAAGVGWGCCRLWASLGMVLHLWTE